MPVLSLLRRAGRAGTLSRMVFAMMIVLALAGGVGLLALFAIGKYNSLIALRNRYRNGFSQIEMQLKRRYDLIPRLAEIAKRYLKHEGETLETVISARNSAYAAGAKAAANPGESGAMRNLAVAEARLNSALGRLLAVAEAHPGFRTDRSVLDLSEELKSIENKIAFARQAYNNAVMAYNKQREAFPADVVAGLFRFAAAELFQIQTSAERSAPKASFT